MKIYRKLICFIDRMIIDLLRLRFGIALKIEIKKRKMGLPIRVPEIEACKLNGIKKFANSKKANSLFFEQLFTKIMEESVRLQTEQRKKINS